MDCIPHSSFLKHLRLRFATVITWNKCLMKSPFFAGHFIKFWEKFTWFNKTWLIVHPCWDSKCWKVLSQQKTSQWRPASQQLTTGWLTMWSPATRCSFDDQPSHFFLTNLTNVRRFLADFCESKYNNLPSDMYQIVSSYNGKVTLWDLI